MNIQIPLALLPSVIFFLLCLIPTLSIIWYFKKQTEKKKSPLNIDLLRSPGESLREKIQDLTYDIIESLSLIPTCSVVIYGMITTQLLTSTDKKIDSISIVIYSTFAIFLVLYLIRKVLKLLKKRNLLRLGYDCELAVGQELNYRMRDGFNVFHDFPADGFNIDHVLVGSTGVFAVETKGRAKEKVAENENWRLKFDGSRLIFPSWIETKPIAQAANQAQWLGDWIIKATGAPCKVEPVLAIPGWFIERTAPSDLKIYNGKNSSFLTKGKQVLNPQQIQAISYQIEQKCRTISSSAYKQDDKK